MGLPSLTAEIVATDLIPERQHRSEILPSRERVVKAAATCRQCVRVKLLISVCRQISQSTGGELVEIRKLSAEAGCASSQDEHTHRTLFRIIQRNETRKVPIEIREGVI